MYVEFTVKPVTKYQLVRYYNAGKEAGSSPIGLFDSADKANEVRELLTEATHPLWVVSDCVGQEGHINLVDRGAGIRPKASVEETVRRLRKELADEQAKGPMDPKLEKFFQGAIAGGEQRLAALGELQTEVRPRANQFLVVKRTFDLETQAYYAQTADEAQATKERLEAETGAEWHVTQRIFR